MRFAYVLYRHLYWETPTTDEHFKEVVGVCSTLEMAKEKASIRQRWTLNWIQVDEIRWVDETRIPFYEVEKFEVDPE